MNVSPATDASAVEETSGHARQTGDLLETDDQVKTDSPFGGRASQTPVTASLVPEVIAETFSTWEAATSSPDLLTTSAAQGSDARNEAAATHPEPGARTEPAARPEPTAPRESVTRTEPAPPREPTARAVSATQPETASRPEPSARPETVTRPESQARVEPTDAKDAAQTSSGAAGSAGASRLRGQGAGEGAEAVRRRRTAAIVEDNLRPRVERLRDASVSMLDDASEDSGLRFVLIAVALFLLFLLFLFLNNILR